MFDFRIIETPDGYQVIDRNLKTPYNALTPLQMVEYMDVDAQLAAMDRMERKTRSDADCRRKTARNPFRRLVSLGIRNTQSGRTNRIVEY